ncbi:MAG: exo-alpha-sialidase, partial [Thermoplasmata archaeon]|nr:exo-alpha-sialidase [Thermoplasmata archaeon]
TFRTDDGGEHWRPTNKGVVVDFMPEKRPEVGQCVHKVAFEPSNSRTLYRQDHNGIFVSHDATDSWQRVGRPLPGDFGFVVAAAPAMPGGAFFVPLEGMARTAMGGQLQVYRWTDKSRKWTATVKGRPWPGELSTHREGLATDRLDPAGIYLGTTTGQLLYSNDGARSYREIPYHFPGIHSVEVLSPESSR